MRAEEAAGAAKARYTDGVADLLNIWDSHCFDLLLGKSSEELAGIARVLDLEGLTPILAPVNLVELGHMGNRRKRAELLRIASFVAHPNWLWMPSEYLLRWHLADGLGDPRLDGFTVDVQPFFTGDAAAHFRDTMVSGSLKKVVRKLGGSKAGLDRMKAAEDLRHAFVHHGFDDALRERDWPDSTGTSEEWTAAYTSAANWLRAERPRTADLAVVWPRSIEAVFTLLGSDDLFFPGYLQVMWEQLGLPGRRGRVEFLYDSIAPGSDGLPDLTEFGVVALAARLIAFQGRRARRTTGNLGDLLLAPYIMAGARIVTLDRGLLNFERQVASNTKFKGHIRSFEDVVRPILVEGPR